MMFDGPLVFASIGLGILFLSPKPDALRPEGVAALVVFAVPGIVLAVPLALAFLSTLTLLFSFVLALLRCCCWVW